MDRVVARRQQHRAGGRTVQSGSEEKVPRSRFGRSSSVRGRWLTAAVRRPPEEFCEPMSGESRERPHQCRGQHILHGPQPSYLVDLQLAPSWCGSEGFLQRHGEIVEQQRESALRTQNLNLTVRGHSVEQRRRQVQPSHDVLAVVYPSGDLRRPERIEVGPRARRPILRAKIGRFRDGTGGQHADQPEPLIGLEARGEWKPLRQRGDQYPQVEVNELMKVNHLVRKSMVDAC